MPIITVADLKAHLSIGGPQHDAVVMNAVNAVNQSVVQYCGRDFDDAGGVSARVFKPRTRCVCVVDDFHTIAGLVVKTDEGDDGTFETTWAATDFQLEPLNGRENGIAVPYYRIVAVESRSFPMLVRASVEVTARWGWASVPAAVKQAALLWAARTFHRKDSPQGVAGFNEFGAVRLTSTDSDIVGPLRLFRRPEHAVLVA
jgi:hypothetical protein